MGWLIGKYAGLTALIALAGWPLIERLGVAVAGAIWPVVSPMQITVIKPTLEPDVTLFRFEADKLRQCGFIKLEAWFGGRGDPLAQPVSIKYLGKRERREAGAVAPPDFWRVEMSVEDLLTASHIDALHHCPYRPWRTRTRFYDPPPPEGDGTEQAP